MLEFSVGFHFTEFENLCQGQGGKGGGVGVGMRFVTENSRSPEPQLSGEKQHSTQPSAEVNPLTTTQGAGLPQALDSLVPRWPQTDAPLSCLAVKIHTAKE